MDSPEADFRNIKAQVAYPRCHGPIEYAMFGSSRRHALVVAVVVMMTRQEQNRIKADGSAL